VCNLGTYMCVFYLQSNLLYTDLTCHCLRHKAWKIRHRNGRCFRSIFICLIIIYICGVIWWRSSQNDIHQGDILLLDDRDSFLERER